jgi:hypothetical protein
MDSIDERLARMSMSTGNLDRGTGHLVLSGHIRFSQSLPAESQTSRLPGCTVYEFSHCRSLVQRQRNGNGDI